jgi:septin family protein
MGRCGSGKTNLFNNLCDTSYDTGIDMASKTKEMDCSSVVNFPNN